MLQAPGINSRGEIVGLAIQKATGELRAYLQLRATTNTRTRRAASIKACPPFKTRHAKAKRSLCRKIFENFFVGDSVFAPTSRAIIGLIFMR